MDKITLITYLLNEVNEELSIRKEYIKELTRAKKEAKESGKSYWNYIKWDKPIPKKSKINDSLKMIRRLSIEFEREFNDYKYDEI